MLSYEKAVHEIESRGIMPDRAPSLDNIQAALTRIGYERFALRPEQVVVVAGTNGKGSVCAALEALTRAAGLRVGLYTSPHLVETTERFRIAGEDIDRVLFSEAFDRVDRCTADLKLSHFETLTAMAAWIFASGERVAPVDRLILEVGLGGLWDATNAIAHRYCVITPLGLDHQNLLGNSLAEIAMNKFGIVGEGASVVHSPLPSELKPLAQNLARRTHSAWHEAAIQPFRVERPAREVEPRYWLDTPWGSVENALKGERGALNASVALEACLKFPGWLGQGMVADQLRACVPALSGIRWPGRMQKLENVKTPCPIYLSGDHNPQGVRSLLALLQDFTWKRIHLIVGVGRDKDAEGVLAPLFALPGSRVYLTVTPFKGRRLTEYGPWIERAQGAFESPLQALNQAIQQAESGDLILVTGSLYLVGEVLRAKPGA